MIGGDVASEGVVAEQQAVAEHLRCQIEDVLRRRIGPPAQHGDGARSRVYVRAFHLGIGQASGKTYEMGGEYRDELRRTPEGWRITRREGVVFWEIGSRAVLGGGRA